MGVLLPSIHVDGYDTNVEPLLILLRDNLILTIHTHQRSRFYQMRRYAEKYLKKLPPRAKTVDMLSLLMIRIIDENNSWNFRQLQEMDERTDDLTMDLKDSNVVQSHVGNQVYQMKHALLQYLSALWGTSDTLSSLRYGDADLFSDMPLMHERIVTLQNEVHQQISLAEHLSDTLASGLESLKSIYNNQLQDRNNQLQDMNNSLQTRNNLLQDFNNTLSEKNNEHSEEQSTHDAGGIPGDFRGWIYSPQHHCDSVLSNQHLPIRTYRYALVSRPYSELNGGYFVPCLLVGEENWSIA